MTTYTHPLGVKPVGSSRTVATRMLRHEDMNGSDRLFGGRLMEWIDDAAGIAARRHAGIAITTVAIDTLEFRYPAFLNDIVTIEAWVTHVERTSMEVRVDSYVENTATGERRMINHDAGALWPGGKHPRGTRRVRRRSQASRAPQGAKGPRHIAGLVRIDSDLLPLRMPASGDSRSERGADCWPGEVTGGVNCNNV